MHFHLDKHETLVVVEGTLILEYIHNKQSYTTKLHKGEAWVVPPGFMHKLKAETEDVIIIEASTYDHPKDSLRVHA